MGLFQRFKDGLRKTHDKLTHEIKRIITRSPKLTGDVIEELEAVLLQADLGTKVTWQILAAVKQAYEAQGKEGLDVFSIASQEVEKILSQTDGQLKKQSEGITVVSIVGVNGTGKTTTCAKLARLLKNQGYTTTMAACDTFRAAAIEQLNIWGERLEVPVISGKYGADAAAVAHDALSSASGAGHDYLLIDTAGRLHTKTNLMSELEKVHRVISRKLVGAPHEVLLVLDGSTGMNALNQARAFHKAVHLTGLVITKLDGTSKGGMVVAIQKELQLPVKYIGVGEKPDDLQPFQPREFAQALFSE